MNWAWQSADCSMGKARFGGRYWTQPNRPGQGRKQEKHPGRRGGRALSVVVAGANVHDTKLLRLTLESIVVHRPEGTQNLCLDQRYAYPTGQGTVGDTGYHGQIGEGKLDQSGKKPIQPGGGWWNAPWAGDPSAGPYWCDRPKSHPITLACSNWLVPLSGTAAAPKLGCEPEIVHVAGSVCFGVFVGRSESEQIPTSELKLRGK